MLRGIKWIFLIALIVVATGCGNSNKTEFGQKIPANLQVVKLEQIMADKASYNNKEVVMEGNFGGICCESDFFYKESLETIEVSSTGFPPPKLVVGTPIRIYGLVDASGDQIHIEAKGVQVK